MNPTYAGFFVKNHEYRSTISADTDGFKLHIEGSRVKKVIVLMFLVATEKDILEGKVTDVYFTRTLHILKSEHVNCKVKAEFVAKKLPEDWPWAVLTGLEEVSHVLKRLPVNARAMPEGTVFYPNEPVLEIEGSYL
ncbi:MAG: hypothetical protein ACXVI8_08235, partial [Halobacteriota archaeon]